MYTPVVRPTLVSFARHRHVRRFCSISTTAIPTFEDTSMRTRLMPIWQKEDNQSCILGAGIFGSVGRGRAHQQSDVDVVLVMKENVTGEPVELEQGAWLIPNAISRFSSRSFDGKT